MTGIVGDLGRKHWTGSRLRGTRGRGYLSGLENGNQALRIMT